MFQRRLTLLALIVVTTLALAVAVRGAARSVQPASHSHATTPPTSISGAARGGFLASGSDPSALPGPLLIADEGNNRLVEINPSGNVAWEFPRPGDLAPGQTFRVPDDAFFTADGKQIVATEEDNFVVTVIDVGKHRIVWRYGTPGTSGSNPGQLANPDDAMMLSDGSVLSADIKNCRIVQLRQNSNAAGPDLGKAVPLPASGRAIEIREPQRCVPAQRRSLPRDRDHTRLGQRD